jgi:hypothetical protein
MKIKFVSIITAFLLTTTLSAASVKDLSFLQGCWKQSYSEKENHYFEDNFTTAAGGIILATSRMVNGETLEFHEFMKIVNDKDDVILTPYPDGEKGVSFKLNPMTNEHEAIFENPEHAFPRTITYRLNEDKTLAAIVAGAVEGKSKKLEFNMSRVTCARQSLPSVRKE